MPLRRILWFTLIALSGLRLLAGDAGNADAIAAQVVPLDQFTVEGRTTDLVGEATTPSEGFVGQVELSERPFLRRGELLEVIPGVVVTQHSGSGKANQYFLRGFNLDHGTDFATTVDGMPVNMRSHAHGEGYSDLNFIIPELVQNIAYQKGPYAAENGDFSAAGAAQFHLVDEVPRGFVKVEAGEHDFFRFVAADTIREADHAATVFGIEASYEDGPWVLPEHSERFNGYVRQTWSSGTNNFALTALGYHGRWQSTDQVPERAITEGTISRFGTIDPTDGGMSDRASLSFDWTSSAGGGTTHVNLYAVYYHLSLFSDFTYFLDDPVHGDQFNQLDRRGVFGGSAERTWTGDFANRKIDAAVGLQVREDVVRLGLHHTEARELIEVIRDDDVNEASVGIYTKGTMHLNDWFRAETGIRDDLYSFDVTSSNPLNSGNRTASIVSPKLELVFGPWNKTELYVDAGYGFHSNDARGTVIKVSPQDGSPVQADNPLVRTKGAELGMRTSTIPGLVSTVSIWALDLDSELVFSGDGGDTEANGPTRRYGVEFANFYRPVPWLTLDADLAFTHARYRDQTNGGRYIPNSIGTVFAGGLMIGQTAGWFGSMRTRFFGSQPIVEDNSVREPSSLTFNGRLGWRSRDWEIALDVLNIFNRANVDIAYYYASRLPGEPVTGVSDVHLHPAEPREMRLNVTRRF